MQIWRSIVRTGACLALAAACSQAPGAAAPGSAGQQGTPAASGSGGGQLSLPPFASDQPSLPPEDTGTRLRVANLWASPAGLGPTLQLVLKDGDGSPAAEIAPGAVSEFIPVPAAKFGDGHTAYDLVDKADSTRTPITSLGSGLVRGDHVTYVINAADAEGKVWNALMLWDTGEPQQGRPWPDVPGDKATVRLYGDALRTLTGASVVVTDADGNCLEPAESGPAGVVSEFAIVDPGPIELIVSHSSSSLECAPGDEIARLPVTLEAGKRLTVFVWGTSTDSLEAIAVPMG